ncbi:MAG: hypothetical protein ACJ71D_09170 [Nitrososphaera sp.]
MLGEKAKEGGGSGAEDVPKDHDNGNEHLISSSPTIITKYAYQSSRLIYSIEKNLYIIIAIVAALAVISVIDAFEVIGITNFVGEGLDDTIIAILSLASLAALLTMLRLSLESKKKLEEWADMFERNSIRNSIRMSMITSSKEELVFAIGEAVKEVGDPLLKYIEGGEFSEFFNVGIGENVFDVLIDSETVMINKGEGENLKKILEVHGAIIAKIVDDKVSKKEIQAFSSAVSKYAAHRGKKIKDAIGLAIIIGKEVLPEAYSITRSGKKVEVKDILLIERP